jgi:UDP-glucuronate 4-epimerase
MNILVTGTAGFIGSSLALKAAERGHDITGIDNINSYYDIDLKYGRLARAGFDKKSVQDGAAVQSALYKNYTFAKTDLRDMDALDRLFDHGGFDCVINLAAQAGVRYSLENPQAYIESNISGFLNILECCRKYKTKHLVYASSSSVYGLNAKAPFSPSDPADHPVSLYAATKRSNELMAHAYAHLFAIPVTGLRFFTVYGPWGRPDMAYYKFSKAIMENRPIEVYNNGEMLRDFTYIDDIIEGILLTLDHIPGPHPLDPRMPRGDRSSAPFVIYNLGNNAPIRLSDFIDTLEKALGKKADKKYLPMQDGDVPATHADIQTTGRDLGWKPRTGIAEGLARFAEWFCGYYKNGLSENNEKNSDYRCDLKI